MGTFTSAVSRPLKASNFCFGVAVGFVSGWVSEAFLALIAVVVYHKQMSPLGSGLL